MNYYLNMVSEQLIFIHNAQVLNAKIYNSWQRSESINCWYFIYAWLAPDSAHISRSQHDRVLH